MASLQTCSSQCTHSTLLFAVNYRLSCNSYDTHSHSVKVDTRQGHCGWEMVAENIYKKKSLQWSFLYGSKWMVPHSQPVSQSFAGELGCRGRASMCFLHALHISVPNHTKSVLHLDKNSFINSKYQNLSTSNSTHDFWHLLAKKKKKIPKQFYFIFSFHVSSRQLHFHFILF